jgi:hypothetical protein
MLENITGWHSTQETKVLGFLKYILSNICQTLVEGGVYRGRAWQILLAAKSNTLEPSFSNYMTSYDVAG